MGGEWEVNGRMCIVWRETHRRRKLLCEVMVLSCSTRWTMGTFCVSCVSEWGTCTVL